MSTPACVSQSRRVSDPVSLSSSPPSTTPPSPASSSSTASGEDEIDEPQASVADTSEPNPIPPEISKTRKVLDMDVFCQILELDDEGDHEFSLSMVNDYFKQAEETFPKFDNFLSDKNLSELSALGHFFKGSSAAIGLAKVQESCEKIQHYGVQRDEEAKRNLKPGEALDKIQNQVAQLREEYAEAKQTLEDWFSKHEDED